MDIKATPEDIHRQVLGLAAGDRLTLKGGDYRRPVVISGVSGTEKEPVVIRGERLPKKGDKWRIWSKTVFGIGPDFNKYRKRGNEIARVEEAAGREPLLRYIADEAILILRDCQWVTLTDLSFENCWPTAIYLENCQNITLKDLHFRGGTFAIGAIGPYTRHLLIEGCDWIQDPSGQGEKDLLSLRKNDKLTAPVQAPGGQLWSELVWTRIHGFRDETKEYVDLDEDARVYDGDFFRAWDIAGYVVLRNNCILDAFNGIHFFNTGPQDLKNEFSRNVLIERNWFVRMRDNAVEPEDFAINWTVRNNYFADCYAPFSFEPDRSGYFYIYGNLCWNRHRPGPKDDERNRGRTFKFGTSHEAVGPHYVMFNTWLMRGPILKKKRLSNFTHMFNVVGYIDDDPDVLSDAGSPFGKGWWLPHDPDADQESVVQVEKKRFTKFWDSLGIAMDGDMINHPSFPEQARLAGYPVGPRASGHKPLFETGAFGEPDGLKVRAVDDGCKETSLPLSGELEILLPDGQTLTAGGGGAVIGAWQKADLFKLEDPEFVRLNPHLQERR